jgi:predicted ArsR family transcriptional regulator
MSHQPAPPEDVRRYRALSSEVRRRLLELLRSEEGVDARRLAQQLDLHVNTVRSHLAVLEEAGLVASVAEERDRPGRPKLLYRATQTATEASRVAEVDGYRLLAQMLASYLGATVDDVAGAAEQAGAAWGHYLIDKPAPFQEVAPEQAVQRLVELMREFGFEPELVTDDPSAPQVELGRCPFLDVAREHQDVVCSVHLGLMRGALDELGSGVRADDLIPWAQPHLCVAHLGVPVES